MVGEVVAPLFSDIPIALKPFGRASSIRPSPLKSAVAAPYSGIRAKLYGSVGKIGAGVCATATIETRKVIRKARSDRARKGVLN